MKKSLTIAAILLAACASGPEPAPPVVMMDAASFNAAMAEARATRNQFQEVARLERLLEKDNLTDEQRASVLFSIASNQGTVIPNRVAAIETYDKVIALVGPEHRLGVLATDNKAYAQTQLGYIRGRVESGTGSFEDALSALPWDEVIERAKNGRIGVTSMEAEKMYLAGRFCESESGRWTIGASNVENKRVDVCDTPRDPINIEALQFN